MEPAGTVTSRKKWPELPAFVTDRGEATGRLHADRKSRLRCKNIGDIWVSSNILNLVGLGDWVALFWWKSRTKEQRIYFKLIFL